MYHIILKLITTSSKETKL